MKELHFDEFTIEVYSRTIYKILKSMVEDKEMSKYFLYMKFQDRRDFEFMLKKKSDDIATEFVRTIKSKGFPDNEIPQDEQKHILKEIIDEHIQT